MQVAEMKTKMEEKLRGLEKEKAVLVEEVRQLKEVVELSERAASLESEVGRLQKEAKTLRDRIPPEVMFVGSVSSSSVRSNAEKDLGSECAGCSSGFG